MTVERLLPKRRGLAELAQIANAEHRASIASLGDALSHAISCGEALLEARERVDGGGWEQWLRENWNFHPQYASWYMRIAYFKDTIPPDIFKPYRDKNGNLQNGSMAAVRAHLKGLPPIRDNTIPREIRDRVKQMRRNGKTYREISEAFGHSAPSWAGRICDPKIYDPRKDYGKLRRERQAATAALREKRRRQDNDSAVKRADNHTVQQTYALLRKCCALLDDGLRQTTDRDERRAIENALHHLYKAEDEIVRASRLQAR